VRTTEGSWGLRLGLAMLWHSAGSCAMWQYLSRCPTAWGCRSVRSWLALSFLLANQGSIKRLAAEVSHFTETLRHL